ncbi:MAG: 2Fe-2S iron-sulfur cluster-binding protein [Halobacteriaceae archaeon]
MDGDTLRVTVVDGDERTVIGAERGRNLRELLLEHDCSPHTRATERLNCGGRGLCGTCGVRIGEPVAPTQWHDRLARRFGYPRLSCQVTVKDDLTVHLPEKLVWGGR